MKPSQRFARDERRLMDFRNAYVDLINHARVESDYLHRTLIPATDHTTWQRKRQAVAVAAGAASLAYDLHGGSYTLRNAAYIVRDVDPVANWEYSLKDPEQLSPQMVIASVESAAATAGRRAEDARDRERGVTGAIAAFLRWPSDLRAAVGDGPAYQTAAAGAVGVLGQILVGALATALATGLVAAVVKLWQLAA